MSYATGKFYARLEVCEGTGGRLVIDDTHVAILTTNADDSQDRWVYADWALESLESLWGYSRRHPATDKTLGWRLNGAIIQIWGTYSCHGYQRLYGDDYMQETNFTISRVRTRLHRPNRKERRRIAMRLRRYAKGEFEQ